MVSVIHCPLMMLRMGHMCICFYVNSTIMQLTFGHKRFVLNKLDQKPLPISSKKYDLIIYLMFVYTAPYRGYMDLAVLKDFLDLLVLR